MLWPLMMLDVGVVVSKRLSKISKGGPAAAFECQRMVAEKMFAASEAGFILATGGHVSKAMKIYRKRVRANARRLK